MDTAEIFFSKYESSVQDLIKQSREMLRNALKGSGEVLDTSSNIIAYGFGTGYKHMICAIIPSKKGIKIGFNKGTELPDPAKMLQGSGKVHKYVVISEVNDLYNPNLKILIKWALQAYKARENL